MRFLVTSSRMPFALDEIRKLGRTGHYVVAADTFRTAPGSHSRFAASHCLVAPPRYQPARFVAQIEEIVRDERIDVVLPAFEEAFYLSRFRASLSRQTELFVPAFDTLATLHDKVRFTRLMAELSLPVPATEVVCDASELRAATARQARYFARPAYSRGGVHLLTNTGPLASVLPIDECRPTPEHPWLVQEYVEGTDLCTFSVAHHGRIAAHSAYVHPREIEHAGGIVFLSVDEPEALAMVRKVVEATGYHGQVSFDLRRGERGLVMLECNPRPTSGVNLMSPEMFTDAVLDRHPGELRVAPAGVRRKISVALIRDMLLNWQEAPEDLAHLVSRAKDVYAEWGDLVPALYQLLSYSHVLSYRRRIGSHKRTDLIAAYFYDICWDGETIGADVAA